MPNEYLNANALQIGGEGGKATGRNRLFLYPLSFEQACDGRKP